MTDDATGDQPSPRFPLLATDPPKIGDFFTDARLLERPSGIAFAGHADDDTPVIILLLSEGAAADAAARDRFAGTINKLHIDTVVARGGEGQHDGRLGHKFRTEEDDPVEPDDTPLAPWAAILDDGSPAAASEADRILSEVDLGYLPQQGAVGGPDYRLHWADRTKPGFSRVWPLPWPGRYDRASWITVIISWLLMLLMAAIAVLIVLLLFQKPPASSNSQTPPPTSQSSSSSSPSPQSGSPSPQSGSPSPQSGSPSPASGSPSPQSGSPSPQSGSPSPASGSPSGQGSPTPNSKL